MPSAMAPLETITSSRPSAASAASLPAPIADGLGIDAATLVRHEAGADLHDDAARVAHRSAHAGPGSEKRGSGSSGTTFFNADTCL